MTDSKTVVEDLAAWLTAVWDGEEQAARYEAGYAEGYHADKVIEYQWVRFVRDTPGGMVWATQFGPGAPSPTQVLARIVADRKILAHCMDMASRCSEDDWPDGGMEYAALSDQARYIVKLKAEQYADRPGFRSEWLVERQGVEG